MIGAGRQTDRPVAPFQQAYPQKLGNPWRARDGVLLLALLPLLVAAPACTITTYDNVPVVDVKAPPMLPKNVPISYRVEPWVYWRDAIFTAKSDFFVAYPSDLEVYEGIAGAFRDSGIFSAANPRLTPPEKGLYCSVEVEYHPINDLEAASLAVSHATSAVVPAYHSTSRHVVRYHLFVDREFKKTYQYSIGATQGAWLGLVPFAWVSFLTPSLGEALRATTYQFFIDAALDGHMRPR